MTSLHDLPKAITSEQEPILLSPPDVGAIEETYVGNAIRSGWIAPVGPDLTAFEAELAAKAGVTHAVGLASGTAALHLGLLSLGVGSGDSVVTSTMTFAATANAIVYCGAQPIFLDCLDDGNMDPELLHETLRDLSDRNRLPKAVVPVDLLGRSADYGRILPIAAEFSVPVLVDAAESFGAHHGGRPTAAMGTAAAVSFNGNKIMTTSGGGALLTDDAALADHARYLSTQARQPVPHYEHTDIGYNYRLSNVLAALGRAQLSRLDSMIERRREVRRSYRVLFEATAGIEILGGEDDAEDNAWLTAVLVDPSATGFSCSELAMHLQMHDIETRRLWKPMHLQPVHSDCLAIGGDVAEGLFERGLALPSGSAMSDAQLSRVVRVIEHFLLEHAVPQASCGRPYSPLEPLSQATSPFLA